MARSPIFGLAALLACVLASCAPGQRHGGSRSVALSRCHLGATGTTARVQALCGSVEVPVDWDAPGGPTIRLRLAVVPASSGRPAPDPLFLFAGGPGHAATESYAPFSAAFAGIRTHRDIVLIDQRGTGGSNALRCDAVLADPSRDPSPEEQVRLLRECAEKLGPGVAHYTTLASIRDFDEVRARLGYERINLYGTSYGTRVALSYLRTYPGRVRSVILDGVVPQQAVLGPAQLAEAPLRVRKAIELRCQREAACRERFPALAEDFDRVEALVRAAPTLTVPHPRTAAPTAVKLSWERWSLTLRLLGYSSETLGLLPHVVHTAAREKSLSAVAALALFIEDLLGATIAGALEYTVLCSEDWPFFTRDMRKAIVGPYGRLEIEQLGRACKVWPHTVAPPGFKEPVRSSVPVLLLSGELDPVTPPEDAARAQGTQREAGAPSFLPQSLHVVAPGQGHGVVARGCIPDLVTRFVEKASVHGLDTSCVANIAPFPIFIDPAGPLP